MASTRLDEIRSDLEHELEIADVEVGRLKSELVAAEKDAKAIKDALAALGRKPGAAAKKPALKKAEVIKGIRSILAKADEPMTREELMVALIELVESNGKSQTGLQLRVKEALAEPQFTISDAGISLTAKASAS